VEDRTANFKETSMAGETIITVVGNLTDDPELRFTPSGAAVANFSVASTPRNFDKNTNEWVDGEAMFLRCSIWRQAAENVAESLQRGMRVVVQGRLKARTYETREGEKRTVFEIEVDEIGPSLKFATAKVNRTSRQGGGGGYSGGGGQGGGQAGGDQSAPAAADPWATPAPAAGGAAGGAAAGGAAASDPWGTPGAPADEPPF
jgi:single-strand DNA-binding protein